MNWLSHFARFDVCEPKAGLNPEYVPLVDRLIQDPLSTEEIAEIDARGLSLASQWVLPSKPLPASYLSFLAWSNGGLFIDGDREFAMLGAEELRDYLLTYELPFIMTGTVPVGTDGQGGLYLIDLRNAVDSNGEYPILHTLADRLTFDDAEPIASAFPDLFTNPN